MFAGFFVNELERNDTIFFCPEYNKTNKIVFSFSADTIIYVFKDSGSIIQIQNNNQ